MKLSNISRVYLYLLYFCAVSCVHSTVFAHYITYDIDVGRLGYRILWYCRAKWLSHTLHMPIVFKPFPYSDSFFLHTREVLFSDELSKNHATKLVYDLSDIDQSLSQKTIFALTKTCKKFSPEFLYEATVADEYFGKSIRCMLQPISTLPELHFPPGYITVAVHIRKGSGGDKPANTKQFFSVVQDIPRATDVLPTRGGASYNGGKLYFLPNQYYVDQINYLADLVHHAPIFIQIFTDYSDPRSLIQEIKDHIHRPNILFADDVLFSKPSKKSALTMYRDHIVADIDAMSRFDCLIRGTSYFSWVSQLLGHHRIVIHPKRTGFQDDLLVARRVTICLRSGSNLITRTITGTYPASEKNVSVIAFLCEQVQLLNILPVQVSQKTEIGTPCMQ